MNKNLNVLYQTSDSYAPITGVSMTSLMINNENIDSINIFVLNDGVSAENLNKMQEVCKQYRRNLIIVDTEDILKKLKTLNVMPFRNSYTTYFKLMAIRILNLEGDRILQIDSDTIINGSLEELCDIDLKDNICAATYDCTMNGYKRLIGIPEEDKFHNCGVLLIHQQNWIDEECEEKIINHLINVRSNYWTVDQDIINLLFRNKIMYLSLTFNFNSGFYIYGVKESLKMYNLKPPYYNSIEEVEEVYKDPIVYHCMGAMTGRPWEADSIHPQNEIFDKYLKLSPWKNYKKEKVKRSLIFRVQRILYQILPRYVYIPIHKIAQKRFLTSMNKKVQK